VLDLDFDANRNAARDRARVCATHSPCRSSASWRTTRRHPPSCGSSSGSSTSSGSCCRGARWRRYGSHRGSRALRGARTLPRPHPHFAAPPVRRRPAAAGSKPAPGVDGAHRHGEAILTPPVEPENSCGPRGAPGPAGPRGHGFTISAPSANRPFAAAPAVWSSWPAPATPWRSTSPGRPTRPASPHPATHHRLRRQFRGPERVHVGARTASARRFGLAHLGRRDARRLHPPRASHGRLSSRAHITVSTRRTLQFDKPLGAFQALAHYMADAETTVDGGPPRHEAAWRCRRPVRRQAGPHGQALRLPTYRDVTPWPSRSWRIGFSVEFDIQPTSAGQALQISWWDNPLPRRAGGRAVLDHRV